MFSLLVYHFHLYTTDMLKFHREICSLPDIFSWVCPQNCYDVMILTNIKDRLSIEFKSPLSWEWQINCVSLRVIKRNEAFWLYVKISMWVGKCIFFNLKQYLRSWSVISLRIIRSPDVLRATAAFEMAVIFPMTSTLRKDCQSWYLNRWWRLHLMNIVD